MNAVILAAGMASRFVPLSEERPKGLLEVRGEILIERQIRQLKEAGISDITIVVGFKAEQFAYLREAFDVNLVFNEDFRCTNNTSSLIKVVDKLDETFICCSDHYFTENVFLGTHNDSFYAASYASGATNEYCLHIDKDDWITDVTIKGSDAWYMAGHAFFNRAFSNQFKAILIREYKKDEIKQCYWEDIFIRHLDELPMKAKKYNNGIICEFDSLDELRQFDPSYITNTRSEIIRRICKELVCRESDLSTFRNIRHTGEYPLFSFLFHSYSFIYNGLDKSIRASTAFEFEKKAVLKHLSEVFPSQDVSTAEISRIGGMSNKNFRIDFHGKSYVLRIPGPGSQGMVDRSNEKNNANEAYKLGVTPEICYFNLQTGIKLTDYLSNAETLNATTVQQSDNLYKIADIYHRLHNSHILLKNEFNIFQEIEKYDSLIARCGAEMYQGWSFFKPKVMRLRSRLELPDITLTPCHNDAVPENFIKADNGSLYLIDWEYSGMNDPIADLAALFLESNFPPDKRNLFLNLYFEGCLPGIVPERILCYEILWDTLWAQWTIIKEALGEYFGPYGKGRYERALDNMKKLENYGR
mgnify:CR=1 FL=1